MVTRLGIACLINSSALMTVVGRRASKPLLMIGHDTVTDRVFLGLLPPWPAPRSHGPEPRCCWQRQRRSPQPAFCVEFMFSLCVSDVSFF